MCTGGDGPDSGGIGPDGMGANAGRSNMGPAEAGAGTIGAGARDAAAAAESDAGPAGLGGAPGAAAGTASGSLGGAPGSFGGLGVGGIGALGEGMAVGTPDAPGTIGGLASGTAIGGMTSFDPNAPTVDSVEGTVDMSSFSPTDADMAAAMAGTTDLAGATLGRGTISIDPSKGVMSSPAAFARAMSPLGMVDKAAGMLSGGVLSGITPAGVVGAVGRGLAAAPGTGQLGAAFGQAMSHDQAVAADMAAQAQSLGLSPSDFAAAMADMQGRAVEASRAAAAMAENPGIMGHAPMSMDQSQTGMTAAALGNLGFDVSRGF